MDFLYVTAPNKNRTATCQKTNSHSFLSERNPLWGSALPSPQVFEHLRAFLRP